MKIKILSFNIHKGLDWKGIKYTLKDIKTLITDCNVQIAFLQEVRGQNLRLKSKGLIHEQFEFLADSIWPYYSYAQNAVYDHGHHGNLILSQFPLKLIQNFDLSTNRLEKRGMLFCQLTIPERTEHRFEHIIHVACLHLNLFHGSRMIQYHTVASAVRCVPNVAERPFILAGDFNDWNQKSCDFFEEHLQMIDAHRAVHHKLALTFPSIFPILPLDRIYTKNLKIISAQVLKDKYFCSDHLPIIVEVELRQ